MAIKLLTPEEVRSMSLEDKDEWWLKNVYRGDMPQLTWRSAITGVILGAVLSLTNLYIAMRIGWMLGVGITSVIIAFAGYKVLSKVGLGREMSLLENNAVQSITASAGYVTAPLISSLAAYTMATGQIVPMHVAILWMLGLAALGVLFAFPMKKRFINDEQMPFPEGMAAGVVMDSLHTSDAKEGLLKAKLLAGGGLLSAAIELLRSDKLVRFVAGVRAIPAYYDDILYRMGLSPSILGTPLSNLTIRLDTSIVLLATGALTGLQTAASMMLGAVLNYVILAPLLIQKGIILPGESGQVGFEEITLWSLWGGVACMTTASLFSFFSKPKVLWASLSGLWRRRGPGERDRLAHIELPTRVSVIGVPIIGLALALMSYFWFDIPIWVGLVSVPLVFIFTLIAVGTTGLTSITPSGQLAQLTQLTFGVLAPGKFATNILSAGVTSEVSAHASNLLMDIKPGYMLGAKPRQQAVGHLLGAVAGLVVAVPIWYIFIIAGDVGRYGTEQIPVPSAVVWKAVSELLMKGLGFLHPTAQYAIIIGGLLGIVIEVSRLATNDRFPISAIGLGLSFVLPFSAVLTIFLGAFGFWLVERRATRFTPATPNTSTPSNTPSAAKEASKPGQENVKVAVDEEANPLAETVATDPSAPPPERTSLPTPPPAAEAPAKVETPKRPWYVIANENRETICAGVIAGGSLTGIALTIADLKLPGVAPLSGMAPAIEAVVTALRAVH